MGKDSKKDNPKKVTSIISGREITQAQYITELVCSRRYKSREGVEAKTGFWNTSHYWGTEYKNQIRKAHALLRMYDFSVIVKVLESESWMFSLHNKQLNQKLLDAQAQQDKQKAALKDKKIEVVQGGNYRSQQFKKKGGGLLNKLKEME